MHFHQSRTFRIIMEHVVFGSMIAFGIALIGGLVIPSVYGHWRTKSETMVYAQLTFVDRRQHTGRSGNRTSAVARYEYEVGGKLYRSDKISVWRTTGQFYPSLNAAFQSGRRIGVYVDPMNPSYAVYDREISILPVVGAVLMAFGSSGMGCYGLWWCYKHGNPKKAQKPTREWQRRQWML